MSRPHPHPPGPTAPLSMTLDDLRPGEAFRVAEIPTPWGMHPLLIVALRIPYDHLAHDYDHHLDGKLRGIVWGMARVPDPAVDPAGFRRARWWDETTTATLEMLRRTEAARITVPWPHHGHMSGPLLGPSK